MVRNKISFLVGLFWSTQFLLAQTSQTIPFQPDYWTISNGGKSSFETFDGRESLVLDGKAVVAGMEFSNGILEVDVYANQARSFAGFIFRKQDGTMEEVYMRMHKSRQPDAVQYTPTYHGESNWQLYPEHQANLTFKQEGWHNLRVEVNNLTTIFYINNEQVLEVPTLKSGNLTGEVGLFALFGNRFSNFRITKSGNAVVKEPYPIITPEKGIIAEWNLTEAKPYIEGQIHFKDLPQTSTIQAFTESTGLLPISKYVPKTASGNFEGNQEVYTVASTIITVDEDQTQLFSFDFSDKIIVFLNGEPLFYGNNAFRSKNNQFQGHLSIGANKLPLKLKKGTNTLHCVVIDRANGWGLMGKLQSL